MNDIGQRAFDLLNKIGFVRMAGTPEELKAAHILMEEIEKIGVKPTLEEFDITDANIEKAELHVLEPYNKTYTVTAYKCCANTPDEGITADFIYAENMNEVDLADAKGKIVLVNGYMRVPTYKNLIKSGCLGFVSLSGSLRDTEDDSDLFTRKIRENQEKIGNIPAVNVRIADAFEMITKKASKVKLVVKNEKVTLKSHNVIAEIKGTKYPDEIISIGSHFDSVEFSTGVYDNGAGSVINMEALRYYKEHPPLRTVKFMWYGSEEIGLEGSKAYTKAHKDELKNHRLMINVDVAGPVIGSDTVKVVGEMSIVNFTDYFLKVNGLSAAVSQGVYSSDCVPFADNGVPAVNFMRFGPEGGAFIHNRHDVIKYLSPEALAKTTNIVLKWSDSVINSVVFPIERKMPKEMVEAVDKYLFKKELEEIEKEAAEKKEEKKA